MFFASDIFVVVYTISCGIWVAFGAGRAIVGVDPTQSEFNTPEKTGGTKTVTLSTGQIPSHNHTITNQSSGAMCDGGYQNIWGNQFSNTNGYGSKCQFLSIQNTGGGQAHNNLMPYISLYVWKRTA